MIITLIIILIFSSVYIFVYRIHLYKQMHLSLMDVYEDKASAPKKAQFIEGILHKISRTFGFLADSRLSRWLARRSLPRRLVMAGSPINIVEFIIFKILSTGIFPILCVIIFYNFEPFYLVISLLAGFVAPDLWLNAKIRRRQREIRRDLPAVIDILKLCVEAGLDFMQAVHKVTEEFKKCALTEELLEVWKETRMGNSRRDALQNLSRRVYILEMSSFVRTLLQADRMGSPMGEALKIQADELRQRRFLQGEEAALKAPIKLLFPLFCFILPAVLIIVAGPIILQFLQGGMIKF